MFELGSLLLLLQNMLLEIEEKVLALAELSLHSQSLLLAEEGGGGGGGHTTKEEAERLAGNLVTLKGSLQELQGMLLEKQDSIQVRWSGRRWRCQGSEVKWGRGEGEEVEEVSRRMLRGDQLKWRWKGEEEEEEEEANK